MTRTINDLMRSQGYKFSDFAVLMRINALTRAYEQEFTKYSVPFRVYGGFRFYERKEVKDLLAYLRVINNPFDSEAVSRIVNVPKRGIGMRTVEILEEYAAENDLSVYDAVLDADELPLNAGGRQKVHAFGALLKSLVLKGAEMSADELIRDVINDSGILSMYADDSDESISKKANIDEFVNSVDEFCRMNKDATLSDFLKPGHAQLGHRRHGRERLRHRRDHPLRKGLEFKVVFVVGMEENIFPVSRAAYDDRELEEERRLMYVAITRARERLFFTRSRSRYLYGERSMTLQSRFMNELSSVLDIEPAPPRLCPCLRLQPQKLRRSEQLRRTQATAVTAAKRMAATAAAAAFRALPAAMRRSTATIATSRPKNPLPLPAPMPRSGIPISWARAKRPPRRARAKKITRLSARASRCSTPSSATASSSPPAAKALR